MMNGCPIVLAALMAASGIASAQEGAPPARTSFGIAAEMGTGWNLGNSMDAIDLGLPRTDESHRARRTRASVSLTIDHRKNGMASDLRISSDLSEMDIGMVHRFLANETYWAKGVQLETLAKSLSHSLCFAGFSGGQQVAFGRVITDFASFGYLRDVFVLPAYRGRGYGQELVEAMLAKLDHEGVAALMLATQDAHSLYRKLGFEAVEGSVKLMRRLRP